MNDDLISRSALEKSMRKSINERYISWTKTITVADIATLIFDEIAYAPTVCNDNYSMGYQDGVRKVLSEERPQGEWIRHIRSIECSVCKNKFFADDENENCQDYEPCIDFNFNYCPNCGAKMTKEAENEI